MKYFRLWGVIILHDIENETDTERDEGPDDQTVLKTDSLIA